MTTVDLLLPCHNESAAILWLAPRVPETVNVILCDNNSDDTSQTLAELAGWSVTHQNGRHRIGDAVLSGIRQSQAEIVCVMDCDGTIDPADVPRLLKPILKGEADVVVGDRSRYASRMPLRHRAASTLRNALLRAAGVGWHLSDLGSARAFRRSVLNDGEYSSLHGGLAWNLDFTLSAIHGVGADRVATVDLPYHQRIGRSQVAGSLTGSIIATRDSIETVVKSRRRKV